MVADLLRKQAYRPEALRLLLADVLGRRHPVLSTSRHLDETAQWILRAQAATRDHGVSGGYTFEDGWLASYPEVTGYIIPTLLTYAAVVGRLDYEKAGLAMAEWELTVQHADGGFPGHFVDRAHPPVVFNTGQIIFGLLAAHDATGDLRFLMSARRAGAWLANVQDGDGAWRRFDYRNAVHVYNTRTAWALAELGKTTGDRRFEETAIRHLDWALSQQRANGFFDHCAFSADEEPFVHTIAYTTQGLLEAGLRLGRQNYVAAAELACRVLLTHLDRDGQLSGTFDAKWRPTAGYSCVTGNAQMAAQWFRLARVTGDRRFGDGARQATRFLKSIHDCATSNPRIRGAVKGSHPIWGRYLFGSYPNWAAKFFMDALLMELADDGGHGVTVRCW